LNKKENIGCVKEVIRFSAEVPKYWTAILKKWRDKCPDIGEIESGLEKNGCADALKPEAKLLYFYEFGLEPPVEQCRFLF